MFQRWLEHVITALIDIQNIDIYEREMDRYLYLNVTYNNGLKVPSWQLSDGTLYLLALTIIPYLPESNRVYIIEEPENGLHPKAIESVIQSLSSIYDGQILITTHSPMILNLTKPKNMICFSKDELGSIAVIKGDKHPKLIHWHESEIDLSVLHASGVLD